MLTVMLKPLQIGDRVRDGVGHYWIVRVILSPYYYVCQCASFHCPNCQTLNGTARIARSALRKDADRC